MADATKHDFYGHSRLSAVQFIYRRLAKSLLDNPDNRPAVLAAAIQELAGSDPELRRIKFFVPEFLVKILDAQELAQLEAAIAGRRRQSARLKMVYPLSSDEFSLDPAFLTSVLDFSGGPSVRPGGRFFTIGSCFANNITLFLAANGHDAKTFSLSEDLNSPISNAFLFDILQRPAETRVQVMAEGLQSIFPGMGEDDARRVAQFKVDGIVQLGGELAEADCVVLTLGNVIDFFKDDLDPGLPLIERVYPKYLAMSVQGDLRGNGNAASRLKKLGATLRMATHAEACEAIAGCIAGIRSITAAPIVVTLSPVPVDTALGLTGTALTTAIEIDCVSKSRLRSAFDEITPALQAAYGPVCYFPSYEMVRWLGPMLKIPTFGQEDGAARHVSGAILDAVCAQFLGAFVQWTDAAAAETAETAAAEVA